MNIWLITSIEMDPAAAPRASAIQNTRTAAALAESGHDVLLWHSRSRLCEPRDWYLKNFGGESPANLRFIAYTPHGERLEKKTPFSTTAATLVNSIRARFSVGAPDLIITRSPLILEQLRAVSFSMLSNARLVLEWQYLESDQLWRGWRRRAKDAPLRECVDRLRQWRRAEMSRLAHADGILCAARDHERLLRAADYQGPTQYLPSGCISVAAPPNASPEFDFGYSGGLTPENGVELAIEALARLDSGRLLLLGPGKDEYLNHLRGRVAALHLSDRVVFAGRVEPSQVREQLQRCRIGLIPISRRCGREKRQFASPLKLIEWMAAGVPTVSANVPSVAGLVRDGEQTLIAQPDNAGSLAEAMRRLSEDEPLRRNLIQNGLNLAGTLTFSNRAARMVSLYDSIKSAHS